jgi:hypothetical protein
MAKKTVNKSAEIRKVLGEHPNETVISIMEMLQKQGVKVEKSAIYTQIKKMRENGTPTGITPRMQQTAETIEPNPILNVPAFHAGDSPLLQHYYDIEALRAMIAREGIYNVKALVERLAKGELGAKPE